MLASNGQVIHNFFYFCIKINLAWLNYKLVLSNLFSEHSLLLYFSLKVYPVLSVKSR